MTEVYKKFDKRIWLMFHNEVFVILDNTALIFRCLFLMEYLGISFSFISDDKSDYIKFH